MIWRVKVQDRFTSLVFAFEFSRGRLGQIGVEFDIATEIVAAQCVYNIVVTSYHDETDGRDVNWFGVA